MILGFALMLLWISMLLGLDPSSHAGRYAGLVFCEIRQFICIPLNLFVYPSLPQPCSWGVSREHGQPRTQGTSPVNPSLSRLSSP